MNEYSATPVHQEARARVFQHFADLGIVAPTVPYPAHRIQEVG